MTLSPVGALPLSEQVYRQLLDAILGGDFAGTLPSERDLAVTFGVNRHAVREAIKRLQQARLVEVSQGGATRVLDHRTSGRLDLLPDLLVRRGRIDLAVVRSVLEMRASIGADAARLCAARSPEVSEALQAHVTAMEPLEGTALEEENRAFWSALVDGSDNIAYRLALNTLVAGLETTADSPLMELLHEEYRRLDAMRVIATAVGAGDAEAAARAAWDLLGPVAQR